jgi:hypothetical protein
LNKPPYSPAMPQITTKRQVEYLREVLLMNRRGLDLSDTSQCKNVEISAISDIANRNGSIRIDHWTASRLL